MEDLKGRSGRILLPLRRITRCGKNTRWMTSRNKRDFADANESRIMWWRDHSGISGRVQCNCQGSIRGRWEGQRPTKEGVTTEAEGKDRTRLREKERDGKVKDKQNVILLVLKTKRAMKLRKTGNL